MSGSFGKYLNNVRLMFLLYTIDDYIHFIKEYRQFEQLTVKYCAFKIEMIFNHDEVLTENLILKWKQMGNNFTRFFLHLNTLNQKEMLNFFQIPIAGKKTLSETESINSAYHIQCALLPDGLADINLLLFYFNSRALDKPIAGIILPHLPIDAEKKAGNGSNWADYIISLPYEKQVFVVLKILQN